MEALRYIQKVTSESLVIKDMGKYLGKHVEIIILPLEKVGESPEGDTVPSVKGFLHKYANPTLMKQEKAAWQKAVEEKHAIC